MHTALLERSVAALHAVRRQISFSANLRSQFGRIKLACKSESEKCFDFEALLGDPPDATSWRIMDHCTAVMRSYALFEAYVGQLLREYLVFLSSAYTLSSLGDDFISKYTRGIGQILLDHDKVRYENLDMTTVIAEASTALSNAKPYQIQPEAMLRTEQNLRMAELMRLFGHCGLSGVDAWISKHRAILNFFSDASRLSQTAESELKEIVQYRNEAAHGDVDQVLGSEVLVEVTEFFEAVLRSITDFVQYDTLSRAKAIGIATVLGRITEKYSNNVIVAKVANCRIEIGDTIYVFGKGQTCISQVQSIQIDDVDQQNIEVADEREVGLGLDVEGKVGLELIRYG